MGDLVLLRDMTKSSALGRAIDLNVLFRHLDFDSLFECIMARAISPPSAEAVAMAFHLIGIRTAVACARTANELTEFARRYSRRLHSSLHLDTRPAAFDPPHLEMGKEFTLSQSITRTGTSHCPRQSADRIALLALRRWRTGAGSGGSMPSARPCTPLRHRVRRARVPADLCHHG